MKSPLLKVVFMQTCCVGNSFLLIFGVIFSYFSTIDSKGVKRDTTQAWSHCELY